MPRILMINSSAGVAEAIDTNDRLDLIRARHGTESESPEPVLGAPDAYSVIFHHCVTGVSGQRNLTLPDDEAPPVASTQFLRRYHEVQGFSVFFVDYFNHEIVGHPDAFRIAQLEYSEPSELRVNPAAGAYNWDKFIDRYGKYFGKLHLAPIKKARGKVLIARGKASPFAVIMEDHNLLLPAPNNVKALPEITSFLLDAVLPNYVSSLGTSGYRSSRMISLAKAVSDQIVQHNETMAKLHLEMESERQQIARIAALERLSGDALVRTMSGLLSEHTGIASIDVSPVLNRPGIYLNQNGIVVMTSPSTGMPPLTDFVAIELSLQKIRQSGAEVSGGVVLYNRGDNVGETGMLKAAARQTGVSLVSGEEIARLLHGVREGQVNATDLLNYLTFGQSTGHPKAA